MLLIIDENECEKNYSKKEFINLIKNDEYINWLETWVFDRNPEVLEIFADPECGILYLSYLKYLENIGKMNHLYNLIHNYSEKNDKLCIKNSYNKFKSSYLLNYNNYLFEIGYCSDPQGSYYSIRKFEAWGSARKKIASNEEYIVKYEDLKKYAIDENFNKELQQLEEDMKNAVDKGTSIEEIETVCNDTIQKIKSKSKTK